MNNNQIIFIIFICVISFYFMFYKSENLTNVSSEQSVIEQIFMYINNNPTGEFIDYINFLSSIKNTNLHIIDNEVFVTFKLLKKKNMFTTDDIKSAMKL